MAILSDATIEETLRTMTTERAIEVCGLLVRACMWDHTGLIISVKELEGISLSEMMVANEKVQLMGKVDGVLHVHCDPRIVAAIYAALHHEPSVSDSGKHMPICLFEDRALVLADISDLGGRG
jgi:hypothetical protein